MRPAVLLGVLLALLLQPLLLSPAAAVEDDPFPPRLRVVAEPVTSFVQPGGTAMITITVWGQARDPIDGVLRVSRPSGWQVTPAEQPFQVPTHGTPVPVEYTVQVTPPADADFGRETLKITARSTDSEAPVKAATEAAVAVSWPAGTTAEASSVHPPGGASFVAGNAIDGDVSTFWNDATVAAYPDELTVITPEPIKISGVGIVTHSAGWISDFTVQTSTDGETWSTRATVKGNSALDREVPFRRAVTASQVRIVVTGNAPSSFGEFTRLIELTPLGG
ncbi:discoidin domain-containing protein [Microlunatus speluncae]|uniref:discoidin domain-containing protein n=1 Tax=Microlunatus speluncae TaxID=2594267 RepID=UPI001375D2A5|nr:discoidin domain-containing protein [Microlunatus speluncae]